MYGNIISSNGFVELGQVEEKEVVLEAPVNYFYLDTDNMCLVFLNQSPNSIYVHHSPFIVKEMPIHSFKIKRYNASLDKDSSGEYSKMTFSYYGFY